MTMWTQIAAQISQAIGATFEVDHQRPVGGGCINQAYAVEGNDRAFFVKLNQASQVAMFEAEALALKQMDRSNTIRVPKPICWGIDEGRSFIVMEWLNFGYGTHESWRTMGHKLAAMHRVRSDRGFGWEMQNTIGATPQPNPWTDNWVTFYIEHRMRHQFRLAARRGGHFPQQDELLSAIPELLSGRDPQPSLVHGDLWSGNAAVTKDGEPVILDPAAYFGDREVDLAMTELFGRFPNEFYTAYNEAYPLDDGYARRKTLYNLYHVVNHFNLFGSGYESQANSMISSLLH